MGTKLFVFGIDGGDLDVVTPLIGAGRMPALSGLMSRGAWSDMTCTEPAHTAPGWASLVTARYPGQHGIYQFYDTQHRSYGARIVGSDDFACSTMWDWLADQGWTLGLVNVPMSHPPVDRPGYSVSWPLSNTLRYSSPPGLLSELARCECHFTSDLACMYRGDPKYVDEAIQNVAARGRSIEYLMKTYPTDAVMVVLTEIDRVCHHYWHYSDATHPRYEADCEPRFRTAIADTYAAIDRVLASLLSLVPHDATVVVVSDHGSGPGYDAFSVHQLLAEHGLLVTSPAPAASGIASWFTDGSTTVDFSRTALFMPVPGSYGLNFNVRGRQLHGLLDPGEVDRFARRVTDLLMAVRHPRTGEPVFRRVVPRSEGYPGRAMESAPDLLLVPYRATTMVSGHLEGPAWKPSYQTGHHRFEGLWVQCSPTVRAGKAAQPLRIVDVAPTALACVGAAFPADVEGVVRADILSNAFWSGGASVLDRRVGPNRRAPGPVTEAEDELVADRLRAMGYL